MTANQTKKLMVKAKALYHIGDLSKTIRRGEVVELSEQDANKSNDLWRGQQFGLLEVKWVYAGAEVAVPKPKTVKVESRLQVPTQPQPPALLPAATQQDVSELRQSIRDLRTDLTALTQQAAKAKAELQGEIVRLETKLADLERPTPKPTWEDPKGRRGPKPKDPKEAGDAGLE